MPLKTSDLISLPMSFAALIVSLLVYWDSHRSAALEQAKVNRDIQTIRTFRNSSRSTDKSIPPDGIGIVYKNIGDVPLTVQEIDAKFEAIPTAAADRACFADLNRTAFLPDVRKDKPQPINKNRIATAQVFFTMPASCQNVIASPLLEIVYSTAETKDPIEDAFLVNIGMSH